MSLASLSALEALMHRQLRAIPLMTTLARYTPPGGSGIDVNLLIDDEALIRVGDAQQTAVQRRVVRFARVEAVPIVRGTLTLDGVTWRIAEPFTADDGQTSWVVERAR
jgi:hypothetical protein